MRDLNEKEIELVSGGDEPFCPAVNPVCPVLLQVQRPDIYFDDNGMGWRSQQDCLRNTERLRREALTQAAVDGARTGAGVGGAAGFAFAGPPGAAAVGIPGAMAGASAEVIYTDITTPTARETCPQRW